MFDYDRTGVEVGLAWLKQVCNKKLTTQHDSAGRVQYVTGAGMISLIARDEWKVLAHEIGHGFGMIYGSQCSISHILIALFRSYS